MTDFIEFLERGSETARGMSAAGILLRVSVLLAAALAVALQCGAPPPHCGILFGRWRCADRC